MIKRSFKIYQKILDESLSNTTVLVWIIAIMITCIWANLNKPNNDLSFAKASIIESKTKDNSYLKINWKLYKLVD